MEVLPMDPVNNNTRERGGAQQMGGIRQEVDDLIKKVRFTLKEWDFLPGSPDDEYDCMIGPLVHLLRRKASRVEIETYLRKELDDHFGINIDDADLDLQNAIDKLFGLIS